MRHRKDFHLVSGDGIRTHDQSSSHFMGINRKQYVLESLNLHFKLLSYLQTKMSPGPVVMGGDSYSRGSGFESRLPRLDRHFHDNLW